MTVALLLAAGSGERLGAGQPKAWVEVAGRPLVSWSLDALARTESVEQVVLTVPPGSDLLLEADVNVSVAAVDGGPSRSESVRLALQAAQGDHGDELVLVHDAARPLLTPELAGSVIAALREDAHAEAAIAAAPVTDTIKRAGGSRVVSETLDRAELWAVQTPQVFRREALERALGAPAEQLARATDDAWLIEQAGGRVLVVPSPAENIKVTNPVDLLLAELLLEQRGRDA
jgi:2-C-methyl-D-erythritol 4-phosphate cytidylyltransferase